MNSTPVQRRLVVAAYALMLLGVSVMPSGALAETPTLVPHQDKLAHALAYAGWAVVLAWALRDRIGRRPAAAWLAGIAALAGTYGLLMELLQAALPWTGRECSWGDALANLAGAVLGAGLSLLRRVPGGG